MTDTNHSDGPPGSDELRRLRALILGDEAQRLHRLDQRVSDPQRRTGDVAEVLPGAMNRAVGDPVTRPEMERPIVETIRSAIQRDARSFAEALFPVLGPAIRRAVADALMSLAQRINAAVEHSFTVKGLRWRLEAARTGEPFAQIVLRHTLRYAVQEVFLIQPHSGLVLAQARRADTVVLDKDAFSAMLTAIQAFIRDSFGAAEGERLTSAELGGRTLWTIDGPGAVLACIVLGSPPAKVREDLMKVLETLHARYASEFDRRPEQLSDRPSVEALLQATLSAEEAAPEAGATSRAGLLWGAAGLAVLALLGWLAWSAWRTDRLEHELVRLFEAEPGYVITAHQSRGSRVSLAGLRDPLAQEPVAVLAAASADTDDVDLSFRPYQSLEEPMVLRRVSAVLGADNGLELNLQGSRLQVRGRPNPDQYALLETLPRTHPLIREVDLPPRQPDPAALREQQIQQLDARLGALDGSEFRFLRGSELTPEAEAALDRLAGALVELQGTAATLGVPLELHLEGFADGTGNARRNREIALDRARTVQSELVARGINAELLTLDPGHWESGPEDPTMRKVLLHAARTPAL